MYMDKNFVEQCEREQLHFSGAIQNHGTLIVTDPQNVVTHFAENLRNYIPADVNIQLGHQLPPPLVNWASELEHKTGARLRLTAAIPGVNCELDVVLSRNAQGAMTIELTQNFDNDNFLQPHFPAFTKPHNTAQLLEYQQTLTDRIFELSGFERVLFYRFRDQGDGEVLAEKRCPKTYGSYLGLRFPASDIPQIARVLYLLNPWRQIPDALATPVPLLGSTTEAPDLSYTDLRSVSPIHALYLSNMGVRTSLSFPLIVGNHLWGLIACHHSQTKLLPQAQLGRISQEVRAYMMSFSAYSSQQRILMTEGLNRRFGDLRNLVYRDGNILSAWAEMAPWLAREFSTDGATICLGEQKIEWGLCFEAHSFDVVDTWFLHAQNELVWLGDCLSRQLSGFEYSQIAGVLAVKVKLPNNQHLRVYLSRQEYIYEVAWGGNPDKPVEYDNGSLSIAPRRSFEKWIEKRIGCSRPWENEARLLALKLREFLVEVGHYD